MLMQYLGQQRHSQDSVFVGLIFKVKIAYAFSELVIAAYQLCQRRVEGHVRKT
jgi:hypothetical protein